MSDIVLNADGTSILFEITYVTNYNQKDCYVVFGEKEVKDFVK